MYMCMYVYIYIYTLFIYIYIYISYTYTYLSLYMCVYTTYIYMCTGQDLLHEDQGRAGELRPRRPCRAMLQCNAYTPSSQSQFAI